MDARSNVNEFNFEFFKDFVYPFYKQPHRFYHTDVHIKNMLKSAYEKNIYLSPAQLLAVWFHDAVYIPGSADNEKLSAELMCAIVKQQSAVRKEFHDMGFVGALPVAQKIILDTKHHLQSTSESPLVLDLDMEILASDYETTYTDYCAKIRQEFSMFSDDEYREGRRKFLIAALENPQIFLTPIFSHLNGIAIRNMKRELISLA